MSCIGGIYSYLLHIHNFTVASSQTLYYARVRETDEGRRQCAAVYSGEGELTDIYCINQCLVMYHIHMSYVLETYILAVATKVLEGKI